MEEAPLVVLMTVSRFHISLFKLKALPQNGILNPFNLMVENTLYNVRNYYTSIVLYCI